MTKRRNKNWAKPAPSKKLGVIQTKQVASVKTDSGRTVKMTVVREIPKSGRLGETADIARAFARLKAMGKPQRDLETYGKRVAKVTTVSKLGVLPRQEQNSENGSKNRENVPTCKQRPSDITSGGGGSRRFIPWCK